MKGSKDMKIKVALFAIILSIVNISAFANEPIALVSGDTFTLSGEAETMYSVAIYKPKDTSSVVKAFSESYDRNDYLLMLEEAAPVDVSNLLVEYRVITTDNTGSFKMNLTLPISGIYGIEVVREYTAECAQFMFAHNLSEIFENNAVAHMSDPDFNKVLINLTDKSEEDIDTYCELFDKLENKVRVANFISSENNEIEAYYASTLIQALMEGSSENAWIVSNLRQELTRLKYDISPIELLEKSSKNALAKLNSKTFTTIGEFLSECYTTSILEGIAAVSYYKEAKVFLAALQNSSYDSCANKDNVAAQIAGKTYSTISALNDAVTRAVAYNTNTEGGSGGGASGATAKPITEGEIPSSYVSNDEKTKQQGHFRDVPADHWGFAYIEALADIGIVRGYSDGQFLPNNPVSRAEFTKMICETFQIEPVSELVFNDVISSDWFSDYVCAAYRAGVIVGDGLSFYPNHQITRQDACVIIYRVAQMNGINFTDGVNAYVDAQDIAEYAETAVEALTASGIVEGNANGEFSPTQMLSRSAAAKIICGILQRR